MKKGFTLIELLVVISIIAVLTGLLLANFVGVRGRAGDIKRKNDLKQLKTALRLYYNDHQHYPLDADVPASGEFNNGAGLVYMKELPPEFSYYSDGDESFLLNVVLESTSDEDATDSQAKCDAEIDDFYEAELTSADYFVCQD